MKNEHKEFIKDGELCFEVKEEYFGSYEEWKTFMNNIGLPAYLNKARLYVDKCKVEYDY